MYQLSLSTCMYEILRWHGIPKPVFFQDFRFRRYIQSQRFTVITSNCYYLHYGFVISTEPTVPCDHFEICTIAIMTLLTVTNELVYFLLLVVKSCPSQFIIYYRIWITGFLPWVTWRTGATSWAVAAYLIL
jgi:hypothetical protein